MAEQDFFVTKKLGRPRGRSLPETKPIRIPVPLLHALASYIAKQAEPQPSESEMIRKILEDRLVHEGFIKPRPGVEIED